jgi:hypothetical protein
VGQVKKWSGKLEVTPFVQFHCVMVARIAEAKLTSLVKRSRVVLEDEFKGDARSFLASTEGTVKMDRKCEFCVACV